MGWAISKVQGVGSDDSPPWTPTTGPFRAAAWEYGSTTSLIPPGATWALSYTGAGYNVTAAKANPAVRILPDLTFDHVLTNPERVQINKWRDELAITGWAAVSGQTVRQALRSMCAALGDTTWDPEAQRLG